MKIPNARFILLDSKKNTDLVLHLNKPNNIEYVRGQSVVIGKTEHFSCQELLLINIDPNIKICEGDRWVYICPINGIDYGEDNKPIVLNHIPDSIKWFDKLHDKQNYYKVIATQEQISEDNIRNFVDTFKQGIVSDVTVVYEKLYSFEAADDFDEVGFCGYRPKLNNNCVTILY
jgi:hypothetical protein